MGFIIAAKGPIRSKDLESRDFAEYFLVGTLASTAVALVAAGYCGWWSWGCGSRGSHAIAFGVEVAPGRGR